MEEDGSISDLRKILSAEDRQAMLKFDLKKPIERDATLNIIDSLTLNVLSGDNMDLDVALRADLASLLTGTLMVEEKLKAAFKKHLGESDSGQLDGDKIIDAYLMAIIEDASNERVLLRIMLNNLNIENMAKFIGIPKKIES